MPGKKGGRKASARGRPKKARASEAKLPHEGERYPASARARSETIVFVHNYGGSKRSVLRHIRLVNALGFDAVAFDLRGMGELTIPLTSDHKHFGLRHVWEEQIGDVLDAVKGAKIVYSLSMPTNSAIAAIAERRAEDVRALVCDGGPFLQLVHCTWNLYTYAYPVDNPVLRAGVTALSLVGYGPGIERALPNMLARIPSGFPVLSIRGGRDPLVPKDAIDQFFSYQDHWAIERKDLSEAGHLDGIKVAPDAYAEMVRAFLAARE